MHYFPVFLEVMHKRVVVVGGGEDALRKVRLLLKTQARIEVIATALDQVLQAIPRVDWVSDVFIGDMLDGAALVFSTDEQLHNLVTAEAKRRGIPVNAVDHAELSSFIVPALVDRDPVVVAIGTEGAAPVLAQDLRALVDVLLPINLGSLARRAAGLRALVAARIPTGATRRGFWHDFFFGRVAEAHQAGDDVAYELTLGDTLFSHAHGAKGRLTVLAPPADPELLTLKAQRRLMEADMIVTREAGAAPLLEMARRDALRCDDIAQALETAAKGHNVVVITQRSAAIARQAQALGCGVEILNNGRADAGIRHAHESLQEAP